MTLATCIQSFRLRTLPLSMSGIVLGSGLAYPMAESRFSFWILFVFAILTTLSLQILSNLCNELGDARHGTDTDQQARMAYGLQSGAITEKQMQTLIYVFVFLCITFGTALVLMSFGTLLCTQSLVFLALGLLAIIGAITYTLGKHSYGYMGLGDLGVFLFFGLLSTMGSYYLQAKELSTEAVLAAIAIGLPIVGVLNLNNIRDMDNDRLHGKRTFAGLLGKTGGKIYHTILLATCFIIFACIHKYYTLIVLPVIIWHLWYIYTHKDSELDLQMPVLMFTTIGIAILGCI